MKDFETVSEHTDNMFGKKSDASTFAGANKTEGRSPQELTETSGKKHLKRLGNPQLRLFCISSSQIGF